MKPQYLKKDSSGTYYHSDKEMKILHREDGPACEFTNGSKCWYKDGRRHRETVPVMRYDNVPEMITINGVQYKLTKM
jgi:hypothetical protein